MRSCELCKRPATAYCQSDEASLCWECDEKVHGANFLVARHSRTLLCHLCQSLTPWNASGAKLAHAISICDTCQRDDDGMDGQVIEAGNSDDGDETTSENYRDQKEGEDGENQVVPWPATTTPPPAASSWSCD